MDDRRAVLLSATRKATHVRQEIVLGMQKVEEDHECDLFLLSSHRAYVANKALPEFALLGNRNIDGWGIGHYVDSSARTIRSQEKAVRGGRASATFATAAECIASPIILGHLRTASQGSRRVENNHPFMLHFLDYDWLLIHNGTASRHEFMSGQERLLIDSDSDTPRIFEFLQRRILEYFHAQPTHSLIHACRNAYQELRRFDSVGTYNIILSNGHLTFVFVDWREFYLLHREKSSGDTALLSTVKLTDKEEWLTIRCHKDQGKVAKMLVFSGPTLVFNGDILE